MADAGNVAGTLDLVGKAHTGDLKQGGIRLLGGQGLNRQADAPLLRTRLQNRRIRLDGYLFPTLADQLIDRRHGIDVYKRQGQARARIYEAFRRLARLHLSPQSVFRRKQQRQSPCVVQRRHAADQVGIQPRSAGNQSQPAAPKKGGKFPDTVDAKTYHFK